MSERDSSTPQPTDPAASRRPRVAIKWAVLVIVLVALVIVNVVAVAVGRKSPPAATISVTGSGTVQGTPDTVRFQVGVQSVAPSAVGALEKNNAEVARPARSE
jgi:uncharacterized protein YggE